VKCVLAESNAFNGSEKCEVLLKRFSVKIFGCANIVVFVNLGTLLYLHFGLYNGSLCNTTVLLLCLLTCTLFKAMFPTVNDLWVSKLKKADVPCDSSWILNDSTGVVEVINKLNLSRYEIDKASPILLQSFDFSTLYTKIDLVDLKACMRILI